MTGARGLTVAALGLLLIGCSSKNVAPGQQTAATGTSSAAASVVTVIATATAARATAATATPSATLGGFEALLAAIPDTPDTRLEVDMTDWALLRREKGVAPLQYPATSDQKEAYAISLAAPIQAGAATFVAGVAGSYALQTQTDRYLGFQRVDQEAMTGTPPAIMEIVRGSFDPKAAEQAIAGCADCPKPDRLTFDGATFYSWGEDFAVDVQRRLAPPAFDALGRGGRILVTDQFVLRTTATAQMHDLIGTLHGGSTLLKNDDFRLAAQALEELGAYGVTITNRTQGPQAATDAISAAPATARGSARSAWNLDDPSVLLAPYTLIGAGAVLDADGQQSSCIVLVQSNAQDAQENADKLKQRIARTSSVISGQPWSQLVPSVETVVRGRVLEVRLKGSKIYTRFLLTNDPLLLHR